MFGIVNEQYERDGGNDNCPQCEETSKECKCPLTDFFDIPPYD